MIHVAKAEAERYHDVVLLHGNLSCVCMRTDAEGCSHILTLRRSDILKFVQRSVIVKIIVSSHRSIIINYRDILDACLDGYLYMGQTS